MREFPWSGPGTATFSRTLSHTAGSGHGEFMAAATIAFLQDYIAATGTLVRTDL
jgi:hypothetical protein